jgi:putative transposase
VVRAEDGPWTSLRERLVPALVPFLHVGPVPLLDGWVEHVNEPQTEAERERLRQSVRRGCPFGTEAWVQDTAVRLGLERTLRPRGRPPKPRQPPETSGQRTLFPKE